MTGGQLCRKTNFHVSALQSVYDAEAGNENREKHTLCYQTSSPKKIDYLVIAVFKGAFQRM